MSKQNTDEELLLYWRDYKYFPYEKELGLLEIQSLFNSKRIKSQSNSVWVQGKISRQKLKRLTYYSKGIYKRRSFSTFQYLLERASRSFNGNSKNKQSTRYSVHGLHEYKGKFNPQIVRAILNILNIRAGSRIYDPFCGSGTTLVECSHMGINCIGTDINPLAAYIANAKLLSLSIPASDIRACNKRILLSFLRRRQTSKVVEMGSERNRYLSKWFRPSTVRDIEMFRQSAIKQGKEINSIFLAIASNLLRNYSLQEPADLRIRRRKSPLPEVPFIEAYKKAFEAFIYNVEYTQSILGCKNNSQVAYVDDVRELESNPKQWQIKPPYHCALTSPPYATALPYIDTQRLSLIWLNLCKPSMIMSLESQLVGSREYKGKLKRELLNNLLSNQGDMPSELHELCMMLHTAVSSKDGFRRQAVPFLLYRYFVDMKKSFESVYSLLSRGAPYALVVGHNQTTLGGQKFDIDTPSYLVIIAEHLGWYFERSIQLQTYQRYGIHQNNSVAKETLLILRKP